jgi:hypothetical protein
MRYDDEYVVKSRRDIEIPRGIEDGSDIENGGWRRMTWVTKASMTKARRKNNMKLLAGRITSPMILLIS